MDRFSNYSRQPYSTQAPTRSQRTPRAAGFKDPDILDDVGSISGSDDGTYALFHESSKQEVDHEPEGADLALTSQTLNADGTPKRPMNAFMIFARRRRPQVSAENQAMRTGEISKLLSKEWSSMPTTDKQFYQEQAKLLKDTFNTKYPDYVYRRRPNNSRRRRRSDANLKTADGANGELGDDGLPVGDFESPTDGEEHFDESLSEASYPRGSHEPPTFGDIKYGTGPTGISRSSTHPFQSNHPIYRNADSRLPYPTSSDRLPHTMSHRVSNPSLNHYSLTSSSSFTNDLAAPQAWHPRMDRGSSAWSNGTQDRSLPSLKTGNYPSAQSSGAWSAGLSSSSGHSSTGSNYSNFSTLTAPFYPSQSNMSDYSNNPGSGGTQYEPVLLQPPDRPYDSRGGSMNEPLGYASRGMSRALPPVASISGYPTAQLPSTSGPMGSPSFWPRS